MTDIPADEPLARGFVLSFALGLSGCAGFERGGAGIDRRRGFRSLAGLALGGGFGQMV